MNRRLVTFLEALVMAAILAVLVQTFLEDFAAPAGWPMALRERIHLAGFFFDLFFTIEFLVRLYYAIVNRRFGRYLGQERGWIDFLAAVPLLMLHSGPQALALLAGGTAAAGLAGGLSLLKVIKAIRIARALRLLRILKLFRPLTSVSAPMAQRHVATVTAISVTVVALAVLFFTMVSERVFSARLPGESPARSFAERQDRTASHLALLRQDPGAFVQALDTLEQTDALLLIVRYRGVTLFSRYSNAVYADAFGPGDYGHLRREDLELFFDRRPYTHQLALQGIGFLAIVILLVLAYRLAYRAHFARTVTDPIRVMRRGIEEPDYNLEVRIPDRYRDDDIFRLAELYNQRYLPLKDRSRGPEAAAALELSDLADLAGPVDPARSGLRRGKRPPRQRED